ncbi:hypothetical protein U9M48_041109 [Paspalum notatum var. saurae]|uniref:Uncharacterized protein n=1 Tax=Paspalum notatum var. saurae TaxID=547442 RepID=A0AAQ3USG2_PASNO
MAGRANLGAEDPVLRCRRETLKSWGCVCLLSHHGTVDFVLFKNKGRDGESFKVVAMDHLGRTLMCDPSLLPAFLRLPSVVSSPKDNPFSFTVGDSLYVMDSFPEPASNGGDREHSFQVLAHGYDDMDWHWHPLPSPPRHMYHDHRGSRYIDSHAVVAGTDILVSNRGGHTYHFDTVEGTWAVAGDRPLAFSSLAEYVPEHRLWFGLSPRSDGQGHWTRRRCTAAGRSTSSRRRSGALKNPTPCTWDAPSSASPGSSRLGDSWSVRTSKCCSPAWRWRDAAKSSGWSSTGPNVTGSPSTPQNIISCFSGDFTANSYSLRRIDMSRFFFLSSSEGEPAPLDRTGGAGATDPSALEDAGSLPDPVLCVSKPRSPSTSMPFFSAAAVHVHFVLFGNKGHDGESLKVVGMDDQGRTFMCDPSLPPVFLQLPHVASPPKGSPFSFTVGDSLYVMDSFIPGRMDSIDPERPLGFGGQQPQHSFQVLSHGHHSSPLCKEWHWHLPPPASAPCHLLDSNYIDSHTVVAGGTDILDPDHRMHLPHFDTVESTWAVAAYQPLPFSGLAEYVPEHGLWFGLSSGRDGSSRFMATVDLERPFLHLGLPRHLLPYGYVQPPQEWWCLQKSYAVYLGSSKFCITRFFKVCPGVYKRADDFQMVLTSVEVESCCKDLRVVKHKSERYKLTLGREYSVI